MNTAEIPQLLKQIKDLYISIREVSILLIENFSDQNLSEFLKTRENLLKEIYQKEALYSKLKTDAPALPEECVQAKKEIRELIISITLMDTRITEMIAASMKSIRQELSGLYCTSKAALAYSTHRRT